MKQSHVWIMLNSSVYLSMTNYNGVIILITFSKKITSGVYAINAVKRYLSVENLKTLYFSFIHSYTSYGAIIWSCAYQYKLYKLEILQKRAIRNICKVKYNEPSTPLFKYLQIPKLADIFNIQLCKYMFSYTTYGLADSQQPIFMTNSSFIPIILDTIETLMSLHVRPLVLPERLFIVHLRSGLIFPILSQILLHPVISAIK